MKYRVTDVWRIVKNMSGRYMLCHTIPVLLFCKDGWTATEDFISSNAVV